MHTDAHSKSRFALTLKVPVQLGHRGQDSQACQYRTLRIIFVREGIPEVHEQTVAEVLRDVALEAQDDPSTGLLICAYDRTQILRI